MTRPFPTTTARRFAALVVAALLVLVGVPLIAQTGLAPETGGTSRYLPTSSTSASFTVSAGRTSTQPTNLFAVGSAGKRYRGCEITFWGAGAADATYDWRVYVVKKGASDEYEKILYCSGTATLGTLAGVSSSGATSSDKFVDTLSSLTLSTYCTSAVAAYGGVNPFVFSPADNTQSRLFIPELGNAEWIIVDFDMTGAASANCYIERGT